jgi:HK97 family phage major capsid protein
MKRTYESTMAEIDAIAAEQRAIIEKAEPSADDKAFLLTAEGEINALRKVANDLHVAEVEALRQAAETAVPVTDTGDKRKAMFDFRDRLRAMTPGEELALFSDKRALAAGSGSGSYLVPQEWHDKVEEYRFEANWLRSEGAQVIKTTSTHNIPVLTANGTAAIVGENTAYTNSEPTVSPVILYAYKLTDKALVSEELLEDASYDVEGLLAKSMGYSFGAAELSYGMTGTGSSQPTGIFNKTTDLTTDTQGVITNDEVIEIVYGLAPEYRDGAVWMMDNTTAFYLATKKVDVSTSGTTPYAWPTLLDGQNPTLVGYKVKLASAIADKANGAKAIAFGNPNQYVIGERGPMKVKRLQLSEYQDTFAFAQRIDMKPLNASAFFVCTIHA